MTDKKFNSLTKSQKRVVIAQDILAYLAAKKMKAAKNAYVGLKLPGGVKMEDDIKKNFDKFKSCTVCALGACLIAATKYVNILHFDDIAYTDNILQGTPVQKVFNKLFTTYQLLLIETAFEGEGWNYSSRYGKSKGFRLQDKDSDKCKTFFKNYKNSTARLQAICSNIIQNKGTFEP